MKLERSKKARFSYEVVPVVSETEMKARKAHQNFRIGFRLLIITNYTSGSATAQNT